MKCTDSSLSGNMIGCLVFCQEVLIDQKKNVHLLLWFYNTRNVLCQPDNLTWDGFCLEKRELQSKYKVGFFIVLFVFFLLWYIFPQNGSHYCCDVLKWRMCLGWFNYHHEYSINLYISVLSLYILTSTVSCGDEFHYVHT